MVDNFTAIPNAIDDSSLDVYQFRIWHRMKRRGICFESQRSIAASTGISLAQVSRTVKWLRSNEWIVPSVDKKSGKVGYEAVIPGEQTQQNYVIPQEHVIPEVEHVIPGERHLKKITKEDTTTAARDGSAVTAYENNIGGLSPRIVDFINDAIDEYSEQTVIDAIYEAVSSKVRRWKYIDAILKNWKKNGRVKPSLNGHSGNGRINKNDLKDNLWKIVARSKNYQEAQNKASPDEWQMLTRMGKWRDVRGLNETTFSIRFYEVYKQHAGN
jgi:DnaD/phage-associated family protein